MHAHWHAPEVAPARSLASSWARFPSHWSHASHGGGIVRHLRVEGCAVSLAPSRRRSIRE
jgi:hypothetical protein